jgi:hypothetical protein
MVFIFESFFHNLSLNGVSSFVSSPPRVAQLM